MESAPLTLAHTHARNAVLETHKSNPVAASEEHDLAAGEFATAAQQSADHEALRTLHLLEDHHKKLAQILRFQHEHPPSAPDPAGENPPLTPVESAAAKEALHVPPKLSTHVRLPARETSSIASNLASARGIPAHPRRASPVSPTLSAQQAGAKMAEGPSKVRTGQSRLRGTQATATKERNRNLISKESLPPPSLGASPTDVTSKQFVPADMAESPHATHREPPGEEPFQRFYSTFEGLISKISAPLAFAGLPLGAESAPSYRKSTAEPKLDRHPATSDRSRQSADPDISKIFSRAALRSLRDPNGGTGPITTASAAESFYVVPTTGGTVSYAGILGRGEGAARRSSLDDGDEDFVDARETPPSPELRHSLTGGRAKKGRAAGSDKFTSLQNPKTMEELQMENQALRHLSDTLSTRLHMWEVNAQSSSMALQQSLRAMHHQSNPSLEHHRPQSPSTVTASAIASPQEPPPPGEQDLRIKELEELIRRSERDLDKAARENDKLRDIVGRYRERWEKLKEGAKTRRAEGRSAADHASRNSPALLPPNSPRPAATGSTPPRQTSTRAEDGGDTENDTTSTNDTKPRADASDS
ncbi:hypothetical protein BDW42DRAFT_69218 [Aspergillus taichungensis]|uniref:Uncharacterized protein n=1 Tax=Aspergillus taichungensis TaxID=482145 RepID=A0A2J5I0B4_9EURO|nr:hypothetical protein BDW42DRAFT_69218 [Aspergillus taichungensis]